jgi:hypothetical protein
MDCPIIKAYGGAFLRMSHLSYRLALVLMLALLSPSTATAAGCSGLSSPEGLSQRWHVKADKPDEHASPTKTITATMDWPIAPAIANSPCEFKFRFEVGATGLRKGARIAVALRHCSSSFWSAPQTSDPKAPGYTTVTSKSKSPLQVRGWNEDKNPNETFLQFFPWQHHITVTLGEALQRGDVVYLRYGDTSQGGPGTQVQMFSEDPFCFLVFLDAEGSGQWERIERLCLPIVAQKATRLVAVAPSLVHPRTPFTLLIRAEDDFGNIDTEYTGKISVDANCLETKYEGPQAAEFTTFDKGIKYIHDVRGSGKGVMRIKVSDGRMSAVSNPTLVSAQLIDNQYDLLWGDIHGHSELSDGRGTPEQYYAYARDVAGLDICALTDHSFMLSDEEWAAIRRVSNKFYKPGRFVTLHGYEWSGYVENGGDHNIYFKGNNAPICRDRSYLDYRNPEIYQGKNLGINHVEDLFIWLDRRGLAGSALVIPHWGGRHANPAWHSPVFQRLVEIFSEHKRSEEWGANFIKKGYKLGVVGSGDGHFGKPGNGYLAPLQQGSKIGMGLTAIMAKKNRAAVFNALYKRRTYATTGDRIIVLMKINNELPGSEVITKWAPFLELDVHGTGSIKSIEVLRNGDTSQEWHPSVADISVSTRLPIPDQDQVDYYQVRVVQENNEVAVTSPIWIRRDVRLSILDGAISVPRIAKVP